MAAFRLLDKVILVPLKSIKENPANWQLHGAFEPQGKDKWLVDSVRDNGVMLPLTLHEAGDLSDGHRRKRAAEAAGLTEVPAIVLDKADAAHAFTTAQLARHMSLYAKCVLFRPQIETLVKAAKENKLFNLQNQGDNRTEARHAVAEDWITLEKTLGASRRFLTNGVATLAKIDSLTTKGDLPQAGRIRTIFRDLGLKPALRMLDGKPEADAADDISDDGPDVESWSQVDEPQAKRGRKKGTPASNKKLQIAKTPTASCEMEGEAWQKKAFKLLANLESLMKENKAYSVHVQKLLDGLEVWISGKPVQSKAA